MISPDKQAYDDPTLIRYLLGSLPEEETVRLDELSIVEDGMAARLVAVENDLVDAYVNGELTGETLTQFQSSYLSSPVKREKVRLAESLRTIGARAAPAENPAATILAAPDPSKPWFHFRIPRWTVNWALATCILIAGCAYLIWDQASLKNQLTQAQVDRTALQRREGELQQQLAERRPEESATQMGEEHSGMPPREQRTVSLTLLAVVRGPGGIASLDVRPGTGRAVLQLQLEFDDFPAYRAVLRDPATDRVLWRSPDLKATTLGGNRAVSIDLPASLLKQQHYSVELSGLPANGAVEPVSSYPFNVVIK